jgi:hypothetical protein
MFVADDRIFAPFTDEQVNALNAWQENDHVHPFTCARRGQPGHLTWKGLLVPTTAGWICPDCGYVQNWAHAFMAKP